MMKLKVKHVNPIHAANYMTLIYAIIGVIYLLIGAGAIAFGDTEAGIGIIIVGIAIPLLAWPFMWLGAVISNLMLKVTKGITVTVDKVKE